MDIVEILRDRRHASLSPAHRESAAREIIDLRTRLAESRRYWGEAQEREAQLRARLAKAEAEIARLRSELGEAMAMVGRVVAVIESLDERRSDGLYRIGRPLYLDMKAMMRRTDQSAIAATPTDKEDSGGQI